MPTATKKPSTKQLPPPPPPPPESLTPTRELNLSHISDDDPFKDILIDLAKTRRTISLRMAEDEEKRKSLDEHIMSILRDNYDAKKIEQIFPGFNLNWLTGTNVQLSAIKLAELGVSADVIAAAKVTKKYTYIQINEVKEKPVKS